MIVELTLALALLSAIGITVFKSSLDLMAPRQWTIYQNISDAYISYEQAYAERVSFEVMTSGSSPWPVYPSRTTTDVEIGKFPGGAAIMATVIRRGAFHAAPLAHRPQPLATPLPNRPVHHQ